MSPDPLDLWPEIEVDPLTPLEILNHQGQALEKHTGGRLRVDVVTTREPAPGKGVLDDSSFRHRFEIVAPLLGYRHQLFTCTHSATLVYPVEVNWTTGGGDQWRVATGQAEFTSIIRDLLTARSTVAVLQSLLARIREISQPVPA